MQDSQLSVLKGCLAEIQLGHRVTLVSVAETWGTSPRQIGSLLAVSSAGKFYGSVSGGCVEEDLIERLVTQPITQPTLLLYGETQEERHRFGLPCGGVLQLVAEPFNNANEIQLLMESIEQRQAIYRTTYFNNDRVLSESFHSSHKAQLTQTAWSNVFGPVWHLVIVGAGETGRFLADMASALGFQITVTDPRPDYRSNWPLQHQFPLADGFPDDVIASMNIDQRTAIVTVAHDPRVDDMALLQALKSDAFYVGALGSKVNNDARRQRLVEHFDFTPQEVNKLAGPVGLPLGSKTPAEIALAIMAEITALKNGVDLKAQLNESAYRSTSASAQAVCELAAL